MKEEKKKNGCLGKIILGLFGTSILLFSIGFFFGDEPTISPEEKLLEEAKNTPWEEQTDRQHEAWIKNYLEHPDENGKVLEFSLRHLVSNKFQYPKSVEFNFVETPFFSSARIIDAYSGAVHIEGGGSAKNAFGMESDFTYIIRLVITPEDQHIKNIDVHQ